MTEFFYIRASNDGRSRHRIGAIAYQIDRANQTISFGWSIVQPQDRGVKFNPIGCKYRAIQRLNKDPIVKSFKEFNDMHHNRLLSTLNIIPHFDRWMALDWCVILYQLGNCVLSLKNEVNGIRADGKSLQAKA